MPLLQLIQRAALWDHWKRPLTLATLGVFWLIINGIMLELASAFVPGFHLRGFAAAFWGAIVLSLVNMLLKWLVPTPRDQA